MIICKPLSCYLKQKYNSKTFSYSYTWNWGRLAKSNTYIIIFNNQSNKAMRAAFDKVAHEVNIVKEIGPCWNTVHPGTLRNTIIIFEKKEALPNESGSQV